MTKSKMTDLEKYEALKLKLNGVRQKDIAEKYGLSESQISKILKEMLYNYRQNNIKELNELISIEEARLDEMYLALKPRIDRGEPRAIEMGIKISERRAKMLDLDAAQKMELSGTLVNLVIEDCGIPDEKNDR